MNIYIYSDESGVFDYIHNSYYVFGGVILLGKEDRDSCERKYRKAERSIAGKYAPGIELKATVISNKDKSKLFRALNAFHKFGIVINQQRIHREIFTSKKAKQRYLDYAYKIGVKHALKNMLHSGLFTPGDVDYIFFYNDEHTTATDGIYELRAALLQELKEGTFNWNYQCYFPPVFPDLKDLQLSYCDSKTKPLIRSADIIANKIYHKAQFHVPQEKSPMLYMTYLP